MPETASSSRISWLPVAWAVGCLALLGLALFSISWSYVDLYNVLREATNASWRQHLRHVFSADLEYRPLFRLGVKAAYEIVGLHLWIYQALVLVQLGAILALLLGLFRTVGASRAVAAVVALSCVLGLHTTRILFLFVPLNAHSGALVLLLVALVLALDPRTRAFEWIFLPLTAIALFTLESGLLIIPLLLVLWARDAPGVSWRGVANAAVALLAYVTVRFSFGSGVSLESSYRGSGLGFSDATPEQLRNIFDHAPWLFWLYNVSASFLSVVFSEPRAGVYQFVESLLRGGAPFWQWLHVGSSLLTTVVVIGVLWVYRPAFERDRLLIAAGLVLVVFGSGLGFLYTRDRIALSSGIGYALLVFVALATILERLPASGLKRAALIGVVCVLAIAWTTRTAELYAQLRDTAWDYHLEWTDRYAELGGTAQPQTELLTSLRSAALGTTPDDPRRDPGWTYVLFERRFDPKGEAHPTVDDAADNAVAPLSSPFHIRWKPDVDETMRQRVEAELGLTDAQQVARDERGRTWEYRLRTPTRARIRTVLLHTAVEDTARVDAQRFEIVR